VCAARVGLYFAAQVAAAIIQYSAGCMPARSYKAQKAFRGEFHFGRQSQNVSQSKQIGFCQVQATCIPAAIHSASVLLP